MSTIAVNLAHETIEKLGHLLGRIEQFERRLVALERRLAPRQPSGPVSPVPDSGNSLKRGRGRPRGSKNRPPPVYIDIEYSAPGL
jgi:hypothetical protein